MMDFEIMNKALKIAWIKRITENVHFASSFSFHSRSL